MKKILKPLFCMLFILSLTTIFNSKSVKAETNKKNISVDEDVLEEYFNLLADENVKVEIFISDNNKSKQKITYAITNEFDKWDTVLNINNLTIIIEHINTDDKTVENIINLCKKAVKIEGSFDYDFFLEKFTKEFLNNIYEALS